MPAPVRLPADRHVLEMILLFAQAEARLKGLLAPAIAARRPGTSARNRVLLRQAQAVLAALSRDAAPRAARAALSSWASGVDMAGGPVAGTLDARPQLAAAEAVARALQDPLDDAIRTVGRNVDDVFRRAGLEAAGRAAITQEARRETAAQIEADMRHQGVTGFVDRAGRRWRLSVYSSMVARTVTREASTAGFVRTYLDRGGDLIEISDHDTETPLCQKFEGNTYSLTGATPGYPVAVALPPFHPNCKHVAHPARARLQTERLLARAGSLEELERALGIAA